MVEFKRIPWAPDEVILALDLYFAEGALDDADPRVIELSQLLRSLPIHPAGDRRHPKFRNPNGVSLKLQNFLALDPGYGGKGMTRYSRTDERVFHVYADRPDELARVATAIRSGLRAFPVEPVEEEQDEAAATEGRLLVRRHVARERKRPLRDKKVRQVQQREGRLACEVCGIEFSEFYGPIGDGYIEVHHRLPLAASGPTSTRLTDLAIVCPNCHRMLHRDHDLTVESLRDMVSERRPS